MEAVNWNSSKEIVQFDVGANVVSPQVAIDDKGNIVVVWEENSSIKGGVLNITQGTLSFISGPTLISNLESATSLKLSMNGSGKAVAVWLGENGLVETSTLKTSDLNTGWSTATALSKTAAIGAQVGVDEIGNTLVIWLGNDQNNDQNIEGVSQIGDNSDWSDVVVISQTNEFKFAPPQIAVNGGIGAAVWEVQTLNESGDEVTSVIEGAIAQIEKNSFVWNKPDILSQKQGNYYNPEVAIGPNGHIIAIWRFFETLGSNGVIQCNEYSGGAWGQVDSPTDPNNLVGMGGFQYVAVKDDLAFAYWIDFTSVGVSKSTFPERSWTSFPEFTAFTYFIDVTLFEGFPQVLWLEAYPPHNLIQVASFVPTLQEFTLSSDNADIILINKQIPMIAGNDEKGIIVAIWLENIHLEDGSIRLGLMAATGIYSSNPETSKMLMYWGVDEALQSDLP